MGAPKRFAAEPPPNEAAPPDRAAKLDKPPPPSGLDPPNPPASVLPVLEPRSPPKPEEPRPPKPVEIWVAKGEVPPKPPADPKPPVLCSGEASDPNPPAALAELLPNTENGDFSEPEKAERPEDANAEVEVLGLSVACPLRSLDAASAVRGDFDLENAAKGEAIAVFAKAEVV